MKKKRIIVLAHIDLIPPENVNEKDINRYSTPWVTEYDVIKCLKELGHDVLPLGVYSDLSTLKNAIDQFKPHLVFNLLEEFDGEAIFDQNIVSYLELLRVPFTGCNPRGLMISRDKALAKKILTFHRIKTPLFQTYPKNKKFKIPKRLKFPCIVKCQNEEASLGIGKASIVNNLEKLKERISFIHEKLNDDALVEEFIEGREFYIGVLGNKKLKTLPVWELVFEKSDSPDKELYSRRAKWNEKYRERKGIKTKKANLDDDLFKIASKIAKKTYKALGLSGYARIDLRMNNENQFFVIEANPNPNIAKDDEFALSAKSCGENYPQLISNILKLS